MTWGAVVRDGITYANDLNSGLWLLKFEPKKPVVP
jgi:hypothetical protein